MKEIILTRGQIAIVDDEDYDWARQYKWCARKDRGVFYAVRSIKIPKTRRNIIFNMHREILGLKSGDGKIVDHINRNGCDNRRCNLRVTTHSLNMFNSKRRADNSSGYRGVYWHKASKKWCARICKDKNEIYCGCFDDIIIAAQARDEMAQKLWGDNAVLNFPKEKL